MGLTKKKKVELVGTLQGKKVEKKRSKTSPVDLYCRSKQERCKRQARPKAKGDPEGTLRDSEVMNKKTTQNGGEDDEKRKTYLAGEK